MAVRQLHYCTHCGLPLLPGPDPSPGAPAAHFCRACGSPVRAARNVEQAPAVYLVPDLPPPPAGLRWAVAALIDLALACVGGLIVAAAGAQVTLMVTAGASAGARAGINGIAWAAGALAVLAYQPFFWLRHRPSPGQRLLGMNARRPRHLLR